MRNYVAFLSTFLFYLAFGVFFSRIDTAINKEPLSQTAPQDFYDYSGVLNVHSNKSTGGLSVQEIINKASEAGLDFIIFNEESILNQKQPHAIKYGSLNVFYGFEHNFNGSDLLYTEIENNQTFTSYSEVQFFLLEQLENSGEGLLVLAHPDKPGFEWTESKDLKVTGLEVLNLREIWRQAWESRKLQFLTSIVFYPFNPKLFFLSIYSDSNLSLKAWEDWNRFKPTYGFVGSDVTSKLRLGKKTHLNFPGYKNIFSMAKNHIVTSEELTGFSDGQKIIQALKSGQFYFSLDIFGNPEGFVFYVENKAKEKGLMGKVLSFQEGQKIKVRVPSRAKNIKIQLIKDNKVLQTYREDFEFEVDQIGTYRVQVLVDPFFPIFRSQKWIPWILSNPIYLR